MVKLVAFDWNGTLIADAIYTFQGVNLALKKLGRKPITYKEFLDVSQVPVVNIYTSFGLSKEEFLKNSKEIAALFHEIYEEKVKKVRTRAGARQILAYLKKHRIKPLIFSNHTISGIGYQLKRLKLGEIEVLANKENHTSFIKSKESMFKAYIKKFKLTPQEIMLVGDSTEEVEIGKGLGTVTVAFQGGYTSLKRLLKAKPDYLISNLGELVEIIDAINKKII